MMNRKEMMNARAALIEAHRSSHTPVEAVQTLVTRLGYENARDIVALAVIAKGEWDGRIGNDRRKWASETTDTTRDTLSNMYFFYPDEIHPVHFDQIARVMAAYNPA